jgi:hypothetical protein
MIKVLIFILASCDTSNIRKNYPLDQTAQLIKRQGGYNSYSMSKNLSEDKNFDTFNDKKINSSNEGSETKKYCIESYIYSLYPVEKNDNNIISTYQIKKNNNIYKYNIIFDEKDFSAKAFVVDKNLYKNDDKESLLLKNRINSVCN